jgi:Rrf2 family protein
MKLSTKGRYGLKAMLYIAHYSGEKPVTIKAIAEFHGISEPYLEQLAAILKKSGLIKSIRGAQGGYILTKDPKDIVVGDIIRVLEGPLTISECTAEEYPTECANADFCVSRGLWERLRESISSVLDSMTLKDKKKKKKEKLKDRTK